MASPPPFSKRRAMQQFLQRNPNAAKRGPGAPGSVPGPRKPVAQAGRKDSVANSMASEARGRQAYKDSMAAQARNQSAASNAAYKNSLAAQARNQASKPRKPGLPGKRKFTNNAPFARY